MTGWGRHSSGQGGFKENPFQDQSSIDLQPNRLAPLGAVSSGSATTLTTGAADWARAEFGLGTDILICLSRLTPALLVRAAATTIKVFDGVTPPTRYAFKTSGGITRGTASGAITLTGMSEPWLLLWYGDDTTLQSNRSPKPTMANDWNDPDGEWYAADLPVLLIFQDDIRLRSRSTRRT